MDEPENKAALPDLYFEDIEIGARFYIAGRVLTEADLSQFADLSGDHHPIHTDEAYARTTPFGRRIAHGSLGIAIALGMLWKLTQFNRATIAMLDITEWAFRAPVFIGDVLALDVTIAGKRKRRETSGIVQRRLRLLKQDGTVAQEGLTSLLMACRTSGEAGRRDL
jgi:acyl dehydratase